MPNNYNKPPAWAAHPLLRKWNRLMWFFGGNFVEHAADEGLNKAETLKMELIEKGQGHMCSQRPPV